MLQLRRAFHVCEQQRHRPAWQFAHAPR
jgi:hypothetical protein